MIATRCKFKVAEVTLMSWCEKVKLRAEYDPALPEDQSFSEATPTGDMEFAVTNKGLHGQFKPGQFYYIDLVPVE